MVPPTHDDQYRCDGSSYVLVGTRVLSREAQSKRFLPHTSSKPATPKYNNLFMFFASAVDARFVFVSSGLCSAAIRSQSHNRGAGFEPATARQAAGRGDGASHGGMQQSGARARRRTVRWRAPTMRYQGRLIFVPGVGSCPRFFFFSRCGISVSGFCCLLLYVVITGLP